MWALEFREACTYQVRNMHWRIASAICAAVIQFGQTGQGRIEWVSQDRIRLRTSGAIAEMRIDHARGRLIVFHLATIR